MDPIDYISGSTNLYSSFANSPLVRMDYNGYVSYPIGFGGRPVPILHDPKDPLELFIYGDDSRIKGNIRGFKLSDY